MGIMISIIALVLKDSTSVISRHIKTNGIQIELLYLNAYSNQQN